MPDLEERAGRVVSWLLENELAIPGLSEEPVLTGQGYRPGPRANEALAYPNDHLQALRTNGVAVQTERRSYWSSHSPEALCPSCGQHLDMDEWLEVLEDWSTGAGSGRIECGSCSLAVPLCAMAMEDAWGFSDFAVSFWNWGELSYDWTQQLQSVMGVPLIRVWEHI